MSKQDNIKVVPQDDDSDGEFRPVEDSSEEYDKAVAYSDKVKEESREELPFTQEGQEKAAEEAEGSAAIGKVVGYATHPDTPVTLTPDEVTPSLNDAEAKAKALNVPVGTV